MLPWIFKQNKVKVLLVTRQPYTVLSSRPKLGEDPASLIAFNRHRANLKIVERTRDSFGIDMLEDSSTVSALWGIQDQLPIRGATEGAHALVAYEKLRPRMVKSNFHARPSGCSVCLHFSLSLIAGFAEETGRCIFVFSPQSMARNTLSE